MMPDDPLAIWREYLDPNPFLAAAHPSILREVGHRLGEVQVYLAALNDDRADEQEYGLAIANMAVDFACKLLDHLWLECLDGPAPPIINLTMAQVAVKNLLATVRGHTEAWQRAAENDAVAPMQDETEAAIPTQNEPDVDASTHDAEFSAAPVQDLVIDRDTFTVTYKGIPAFLGNKRAFWLLERLQHARGTFLSIKTLIDDVLEGQGSQQRSRPAADKHPPYQAESGWD